MKKFFLFFIINNIVFCDDSMNYIIDNIYLGNKVAARNETFLKEYNITTVVNCAKDLILEYKEIKFLELNLVDNLEQNLFPRFEVAYKFIKLNSEHNILIFCGLGMSRSASLVIFYLMKEKGWDYDICKEYIKKRRPILPNTGFEKQLREYYFQNIRK